MDLFSLWGLSLNQTLLLLALLLVVADIFIASDLLSHIAYALTATVVGLALEAPPLVKVAAGLFAWFAIVALHYLLWKSLLQRITNTLIAPDRYHSGAEGLIGRTGTIRLLEDARMVSVAGDLWPLHGEGTFTDGQSVTITAVEQGALVVTTNNQTSTPQPS